MKNKRLKELMKLEGNLEVRYWVLDMEVDNVTRRVNDKESKIQRLQERKKLNCISRWLRDFIYKTKEPIGQELDDLIESEQKDRSQLAAQQQTLLELMSRVAKIKNKVNARITKLKKPIETFEDEVIENLISYLEKYKSKT